MRILVTGAGGFLGGHIARRLVDADFDVIAATRASPIEPPQSPTSARRFMILRTDLASGRLPSPIDAIVHAGSTSAWPGISVDRMIRDNVLATQKVVHHALQAKAAAFVLCSSVSAFGTIGVPVLTESEPSVDVDVYGLTKLLSEKMLADVANSLPSLSIRLPAVVGRGSKRNWPSECLRKLKGGDALEIFNLDAPFNNLVHETDIAALVTSAFQRGLSGAETILAAASGQTTIAGALRILIEGTGSTSKVIAVKRERIAFLIDSRKASRLYGFAPMHVEDALRKFVKDNSASARSA